MADEAPRAAGRQPGRTLRSVARPARAGQPGLARTGDRQRAQGGGPDVSGGEPGPDAKGTRETRSASAATSKPLESSTRNKLVCAVHKGTSGGLRHDSVIPTAAMAA